MNLSSSVNASPIQWQADQGNTFPQQDTRDTILQCIHLLGHFCGGVRHEILLMSNRCLCSIKVGKHNEICNLDVCMIMQVNSNDTKWEKLTLKWLELTQELASASTILSRVPWSCSSCGHLSCRISSTISWPNCSLLLRSLSITCSSKYSVAITSSSSSAIGGESMSAHKRPPSSSSHVQSDKDPIVDKSLGCVFKPVTVLRRQLAFLAESPWAP